MSHHTLNIFISYARADGREYADHLYNALGQRGINAWRDERNINPYQDFSAELEKAIESASHVAVCVTRDSKRNDSFVRREIGYALALGKPIIPLRFVDIPQHIPIINHTRIDFFEDWDIAFDQLVERLYNVETVQVKANLPDDPLREYLENLYKQIVEFLDNTVFTLIDLRTKPSRASALAEQPSVQALPMGFVGLPIKKRSKVKKTSSFSSLPEAFEHYNEQVLLLGEPGAGKTTTLMAYARELVARRLQDPSIPLPLIAPISSWPAEESTPLPHWLADIIDLDAQFVEKTINEGKALLLLDGLDELGIQRIIFEEDNNGPSREKERFDPRQRFLTVVKPYITANRTLITCREREYFEIGQKISLRGAIKLQPLSLKQMREYLRDYPDLWQAIQSDAALKDMASTPLVLSLLTFGYSNLGSQAEKLRNLHSSPNDLRDKIFETYVHRRYEHEKMRTHIPTKCSLGKMYEILGYVAAFDVTNWSNNRVDSGDFVMAFTELGYLNSDSDEDISDFIEFVSRLHILTKSDKYLYRFLHLLIRDYFAFHYCIQELERSPEHIYAISILGLLGDNRAAKPLIEIAVNKNLDVDIRASAIESLTSIADESVIDVLIDVMKEEHSSLRMAAIASLTTFDTERVLDPIIEILAESDNFVREHALEDLKRFSDPRLIEPMIKYLNDYGLRRVVLEPLISLGKKFQRQFLAAVSASDVNIRQLIVEELGSRYEISLLTEFLFDEDHRVRLDAAKEFESLNWHPPNPQYEIAFHIAKQDWFECASMGEIALETLLRTLKQTRNEILRAELVETIAIIGNSTKIKTLAKKLRLNSEEIQEILCVLNS